MFENNFFLAVRLNINFLIRDVCYSYLVLFFLPDEEDDSATEGDLW